MSEVKLRSDDKLFAKYEKVVSNFKKISRVIGVDRALDISDTPIKFNFFHVIDYTLLMHYMCSVIYIICSKFDNKMEIIRPMTLCPLAVQVWKFVKYY